MNLFLHYIITCKLNDLSVSVKELMLRRTFYLGPNNPYKCIKPFVNLQKKC